MTSAALLAQIRRIWPLDWEIDPGATNPCVVTAEHGALVVAVALTAPLTVVGSLGDEEFFAAEAEADELAAALAALEEAFRKLVDVPGALQHVSRQVRQAAPAGPREAPAQGQTPGLPQEEECRASALADQSTAGPPCTSGDQPGGQSVLR